MKISFWKDKSCSVWFLSETIAKTLVSLSNKFCVLLRLVVGVELFVSKIEYGKTIFASVPFIIKLLPLIFLSSAFITNVCA